MSDNWSNEKLKEFIKNTLGCGCPEKIFEKIDVCRCLIEKNESEITRIVVGDKLLIYIIRPESTDKLVDKVKVFGLAGKEDRDKHNYNRFRLVLSDVENMAQKDQVSECFLSAFEKDEKMHMHFVKEEMIAGL